jgi:hypothetical protein
VKKKRVQGIRDSEEEAEAGDYTFYIKIKKGEIILIILIRLDFSFKKKNLDFLFIIRE